MGEATHQKAILVVEDDHSMMEIITFLLEDEGYEVYQANDGNAALTVLREITPDLIVSDVMMPGMDGFTFYERTRANIAWSQIPFIFLTARGQRADIRRGMGLGADDYLTKPFEPEELLEAVKVRLARAAEVQATLEKASSDLQEKIVRTLSHEFRTPLSLVVGYTDLLESTGQQIDEESFQTILEGLHSGSQRLMKLVEDFLLLSRLQTGSIAREIRREPRTTEGPDSVVSGVVERFERRAAARDVQLTVVPGSPGLTVAVGDQHLGEIVSRLVDNAIKFSKSKGGQVVVTTHQEDNFWVLDIADDGVGIPKEALSWIFQAFRQADREKMEQQGTGVGLAIVQGLVEAYGGRVAVESTPGEGSTFTVWLPLSAE